jgi:hypothetical protein
MGIFGKQRKSALINNDRGGSTVNASELTLRTHDLYFREEDGFPDEYYFAAY